MSRRHLAHLIVHRVCHNKHVHKKTTGSFFDMSVWLHKVKTKPKTRIRINLFQSQRYVLSVYTSKHQFPIHPLLALSFRFRFWLWPQEEKSTSAPSQPKEQQKRQRERWWGGGVRVAPSTGTQNRKMKQTQKKRRNTQNKY